MLFVDAFISQSLEFYDCTCVLYCLLQTPPENNEQLGRRQSTPRVKYSLARTHKCTHKCAHTRARAHTHTHTHTHRTHAHPVQFSLPQAHELKSQLSSSWSQYRGKLSLSRSAQPTDAQSKHECCQAYRNVNIDTGLVPANRETRVLFLQLLTS